MLLLLLQFFPPFFPPLVEVALLDESMMNSVHLHSTGRLAAAAASFYIDATQSLPELASDSLPPLPLHFNKLKALSLRFFFTSLYDCDDDAIDSLCFSLPLPLSLLTPLLYFQTDSDSDRDNQLQPTKSRFITFLSLPFDLCQALCQ